VYKTAADHSILGACSSDVSHDQEDWLEYTRIDWGYGRVTVHDGYSLTFEFVLSKVRASIDCSDC